MLARIIAIEHYGRECSALAWGASKWRPSVNVITDCWRDAGRFSFAPSCHSYGLHAVGHGPKGPTGITLQLLQTMHEAATSSHGAWAQHFFQWAPSCTIKQ